MSEEEFNSTSRFQRGVSNEDINKYFLSSKAYLMEKNSNGESVYDILCGLLPRMRNFPNKDLRLLIHNEKNTNSFAPLKHGKVSTFVKSHQREMNPAQRTCNLIHQGLKVAKIEREIKQRERKELEEKMKKEEEGDEEVKLPKTPSTSGMADVMEENQLYALAGVGLSNIEAMKLSISMKILKQKHNLKKLRFFGKIYGREKNYLICESEHLESHKPKKKMEPPKVKPPPPDPENLPQEDPSIGTNKWTYWVCNNAGESWIKLPDIMPIQINCARVIKKAFTGNLNASIRSYPKFPGLEKHYLRAQISRIGSATVLAPKGLLAEPEENADAGEEEGEEEEVKEKDDYVLVEEFEGLEPSAMLEQENWVHLYPHIQQYGRCTKYRAPKPKTEDEEEDEQADEEDDEEEQNKIPLLRSIDEDDKIQMGRKKKVKKKKKEGDEEGGEEEEEEEEEEEIKEDEGEEDGEEGKKERFDKKLPAWTVKLYNNTLNPQYAVAIARSIRWPGAFSFCCERGYRFGSVYFGDGTKFTGSPFSPMMPSPVQRDVPELKEVKDPTVVNERRVKNGEPPLEEGEKEETVEEEEEEGEEDDE